MQERTPKSFLFHFTTLLLAAGLSACQGGVSELTVSDDAGSVGVTSQAPAEKMPMSDSDGAEASGDEAGGASIVLAGGCFWCTEAVFEELAGVQDVVSGYAGGSADDADYKRVSAGRTDHAEVIRVRYDPARIGLEQLLEVFFTVAHDPTQLNRQGPDHGRQYRSAIFFADEAQRSLAAKVIAARDAAGLHDDPIVTTLEPLEGFYAAEGYHQDFVRHNPNQGYVMRYALPKVAKLHKRFPELTVAE